MFPSTNQDSRENKTNCFPRDHTLSVYYVLLKKVDNQGYNDHGFSMQDVAMRVLQSPLGFVFTR